MRFIKLKDRVDRDDVFINLDLVTRIVFKDNENIIDLFVVGRDRELCYLLPESDYESVKRDIVCEISDVPNYYSVDDLVKLTGFSKQTIYQKNSNGEIPGSVKIGSSLRFDSREIKSWLSRTQDK